MMKDRRAASERHDLRRVQNGLGKSGAEHYFGPKDSVINTTRAAVLLGYDWRERNAGCEAIRRYIQIGLIVARQMYRLGGQRSSRYQVSKLSVLELKAKLQCQVGQSEPLG